MIPTPGNNPLQAPPQLRNHWLHPSGGLRWHLRALRYRATLWQGLCTQLAQWLEDWQPPCTQLLLIGPSAGWTLPAAWLARFERISVLEPDPLARLLLAYRLRQLPLHFATLDVFAPGGFAALRAHYADHALLFCNLLGQLAPAHESAAWCSRLRQALAAQHWASFHDLASSSRAPERTATQHICAGSSFDAVMAHFWHGGELAVSDHGSLTLAGGEGFACLPWTLRPAQHHLVAWVTHHPSAP